MWTTRQFTIRVWLLHVRSTCMCPWKESVQFYVLPHWDRSCRSKLQSHPPIVHWQWASQSNYWPYIGHQAGYLVDSQLLSPWLVWLCQIWTLGLLHSRHVSKLLALEVLAANENDTNYCGDCHATRKCCREGPSNKQSIHKFLSGLVHNTASKWAWCGHQLHKAWSNPKLPLSVAQIRACTLSTASDL